MKNLLTTMLLVLLLAIGTPALAEPPATLTYQGYLTVASGAPVTTPVAMTLSLYATPTGGTALWSEHQSNVEVVNGAYSVLLGSVTPLNLSFDTVYYLGVAVGSDPEMTPRQELSSVPYAFRAMSADHLNQVCADGEVLKYTAASSSWSCAVAAGPQGPAGPAGPQGIQGIVGPAGPAGPQGVAGAAGPQGATGPAGATGAQGLPGATGAVGPQGPVGSTGPQGTAGVTTVMVAGNAALSGTTDPTAGVGVDGDFYVNTTTNMLFGPKAGGAWPAGSVSIIGPQGPQGIQGIQGPQGIAGANGINGATGPQGPQGIQGPAGPQGVAGANGQILIAGNAALSGTTDPGNSIGIDGDFYINTTNNTVFGPKAGGVWPAGSVSIIGPQGPQGIQGPAGATGPAGPQGATGATGATGPQGPQGIQGVAGVDGRTVIAGKAVLNGTVNPTAADGVDGDFYINTTTTVLYGPKTAGVWPVSGVNMIGPQGPQGPAGPAGATGATGATGPQGPVGADGLQGATGAAGADGAAVLNGSGNPTTQGRNGDFYINTATNTIFGPKASGVWPAGVSLNGSQGTAGPQGAQGPAGAIGATGPQGLQGPAGPTGPQGIAGVTTVMVAGNAALSGTVDPTAGVGVDGDFYVNTATSMLFGPKAGGTWPAGSVSIIGPQGPQGIQGPQGPQGVAGADGATGATGPQGPQGPSGPQGP